MDPECQCQVQQDSEFFRRTRSQKFVKKQTRIPSHLSVSAIAGVCVLISKTWANFGWIDYTSWSLNRRQILKFETFPDPDSKILEQERSRNLKKWLRPLLLDFSEKEGFGKKSGGFSAFWWIWFYKIMLYRIWIGFDNLVLNFFATFSFVSELSITAFHLCISFSGVSHIHWNYTLCLPCNQTIGMLYSDARYKFALLCRPIMSSIYQIWNSCEVHWFRPFFDP